MRAVRGATGALSALAKLIPPSAHRVLKEGMEDVPTESLQIGDVVVVKPGEKVHGTGLLVLDWIQAHFRQTCGSAVSTGPQSSAACSLVTHLQASRRAGLPVSYQTQIKTAVRRTGKVRMISVMTSSFRHMRPVRAGVPTRGPRPRRSWPDFGVRRGE